MTGKFKNDFLGIINRKNTLLIIIAFILCIVLYVVLIFPFLKSGGNSQKIPERQTIYGSGFDLTSCDQITEKDVYELCQRIYTRDPEEFEALMVTNKFHGHFGINNIYGARMALYAKRLLDGENWKITVLSEAGTIPPIACFNDGIMASINATFGRGLISNVPGPQKMVATFTYKDRWVKMEVKPEVADEVGKTLKALAQKYGGVLSDEYFLDVRRISVQEWEKYTSPEDLFNLTTSWRGNNSWKEHIENCQYNNANIQKYQKELVEFLKITKDDKKIVEFVNKNECLINGSVKKEKNSITVTSTWESTGGIVTYSLETK